MTLFVTHRELTRLPASTRVTGEGFAAVRRDLLNSTGTATLRGSPSQLNAGGGGGLRGKTDQRVEDSQCPSFDIKVFLL